MSFLDRRTDLYTLTNDDNFAYPFPGFALQRALQYSYDLKGRLNTVTNPQAHTTRNPLLRALGEYGWRYLGDRWRFTPEGPRELRDADHRHDGKAKVVANPSSVRVQASASFTSLVEPERQERLLATLADVQRGGRRCADVWGDAVAGGVTRGANGSSSRRRPGDPRRDCRA